MSIEEQLREYRTTLDTATETAVEHGDRLAPVVRLRPARTLFVAAVAVAAAVGLAFAAVGVTHRNSTSPAGGTTPSTVSTSTSAAPPITVARTVAVPDVHGLTDPQAATVLWYARLNIKHTSVSCVGQVPGTVTRQDPAAGTRVATGTNVTVAVCAVPVAPANVTLPVVVCDTTYGVPPAASDPKAPKSLTIAAPPFTAPKLSGYSDLRGFLPITAPSGWNCKAIEATDGGQGVGVTPPGVTPRDSWGIGGKVTQPPTDGVFGSADPTCGGCVFDDVCAIVPGTEHSFPGLTCPTPPAGEVVTPLGHNLYAIDDPTGALGPDAAHSILKYTPKTATTDAGDVRITCILPASQRNVCTALLDEFLTLPRAFS